MAETSSPICSPECIKAMKALAANPQVCAALKQAEEEQEKRIAEQIELVEIPAPPFKEELRAKAFAQMLRINGLTDVTQDELGNVIARRKGKGNGPVLVLGAHIDTVFAEGTPIKVRKEGNTYYAPGISDDATGLSSLLQVARALHDQKIETEGDIVFVGTLGEEGNGDLRGSKALWNAPNDYDGMIVVDFASVHRLTKGGVGCKRYRITFEGPGGHSMKKFGINGSAVHGICRLVHKIDMIDYPKDPVCTFNVGVIKGGTTVNSIAAQAEIELDIRSYEQKSLEKFVASILPLVEESVKEENEYWHLSDAGKISAKIEQIGDRPAGVNPDDSPVIQASYAAMQELGIELKNYNFGATDQNVPLSRGIPATTQGAGGTEDYNHSVKEYWNCEKAYLGPQLTILTILALVGLKGVTVPVLPKLAR